MHMLKKRRLTTTCKTNLSEFGSKAELCCRCKSEGLFDLKEKHQRKKTAAVFCLVIRHANFYMSTTSVW